MTRQLTFYLYFGALCACIVAVPSKNSLYLAEKSSNKAEQHRFSGLKDANLKKSIPKSDEVKVEKPVNERYPHAVLFGTLCGGTIISPTWILTAGHCILNNFVDYIIAGTSNSKDGSGIIGIVKRKIIHPLFTIGPYWLNPQDYNITQIAARFDFLLAELEDPLPLDNITLASVRLDVNHNFAPKTPVAYAGYGATRYGGTMSKQMHERKLELLSKDECSTLIEYDSQDMICAKGPPPNYDSACNGDSGSGLVDENGVLVGVLSWAEGDKIECRNGSIVYFAKVAEARDWIREITNV